MSLREGDAVRIQLAASDPEQDPLTYSSNLLPGGAFLDPVTGVFEWVPTYYQTGEFMIPFTVWDGVSSTTQTATITVLNVNAAPVFDDLGSWLVQEGQSLRFQAFAFDPDNPGFVPQLRMADGNLTPLEGTDPTVVYTVDNLPPGATFDQEAIMFQWLPGFDSAGQYDVTFTATDDGNGTGVPLFSTHVVSITVLNANRSPNIVEFPNQVVSRDTIQELPIQVTDPDGNPIALEVINALPGYTLPSFVTLVDNGDGTGLLRFAPLRLIVVITR